MTADDLRELFRALDEADDRARGGGPAIPASAGAVRLETQYSQHRAEWDLRREIRHVATAVGFEGVLHKGVRALARLAESGSACAVLREARAPYPRFVGHAMTEDQLRQAVPAEIRPMRTAEMTYSTDGATALLVVPLLRGDACVGHLVSAADTLPSDRFPEAAILGDVVVAALEVAEARDQMREAYLGTMMALARAIEAKDPYTRGHADRVRRFSVTAARGLGLSEERIAGVAVAAALHDIGKIGVPDAVLQKPGELDEQEWRCIREHPVAGDEIISRVPFLQRVRPFVRHHHEKLDGSGYPDGLRGDAIELEARIISVADTFDAATSNRPYRGAMSRAEAASFLRSRVGFHLDASVVEAFLGRLGEEEP